MIKTLISAAVLVSAAGILFAQQNEELPHVVVKAPFDHSTGKHLKTTSTQILYHGGPVMNQSNSVYVIYYGTTFASTTQPIINDFLFGLNGAPQYGVNQTYNAGPNTMAIPPGYFFMPPSIPPATNPSGSVYLDSYSQGTNLNTGDVAAVIAHAIAGGLPYNPNGVYLVITSPDVKIGGFCGSFCAYHTDGNISVSGFARHVRFALIPDPSQRCSACNGGIFVYGDTTTPNGDMGADTMTDDIIHELSEIVTDPDISAWFTQNGAENGDLCNYVYGSTQVAVSATGAMYHYNAILPKVSSGSRPYLIQQIWKNFGAGACASQ
jgi:hypothetical protein